MRDVHTLGTVQEETNLRTTAQPLRQAGTASSARLVHSEPARSTTTCSHDRSNRPHIPPHEQVFAPNAQVLAAEREMERINAHQNEVIQQARHGNFIAGQFVATPLTANPRQYQSQPQHDPTPVHNNAYRMAHLVPPTTEARHDAHATMNPVGKLIYVYFTNTM